MVDFAAHFTIHATKISFKKNSTFYLESVVLESRSSTNCRSEHSLRYFHLGRTSDLCVLYSSLEFPHAASSRKRFRVAY